MRKVRFGIIGAGSIARKFAKDIQAVSNAELVAIASRNIEKAKKFSTEFNLNHYFGSYEELVLSNEIDAIYVATPHNYHKDHAILAMNHSKHVLCEKPIALNTSQFEEMVQAATKNNVLFMEAMWTRFLPSLSFVKQVIEEKKYGNIKKIQASFGFNIGDLKNHENGRLLNIQLAGGSLLDVGVYPISIAMFLHPKEIKTIKASAAFYDTGVDLNTTIFMNTEDNVEFELYSAIDKELVNDCIITLDDAVIRIPDFWCSQSVQINNELMKFPFKKEGFEYEIESFSKSLLDNQGENDIMTHEETRKVISILDQVRKIIGLKYPNE